MPELPEVETTCRGIAKALTGKRIAQVLQRRLDLRLPFPKNLAERLKNRKILSVHRRAKYILIELDKAEHLLIHLGMSGRMVFEHAPHIKINKHDHLIFYFDARKKFCLKFNDPRRFGLCDLIPSKQLNSHKLLKHLGVEPLENDLTTSYLADCFKGKKTSIKTALLDQRIISGLGNIYVCEALFHAGINPKRRAGACSPAQLSKLVPAIRKILNAAIKAGGSSLRDYVQSDGNLGFFQNHFAVYDREGTVCPKCRKSRQKTGCVLRITQGGRSSFYCVRTQK